MSAAAAVHAAHVWRHGPVLWTPIPPHHQHQQPGGGGGGHAAARDAQDGAALQAEHPGATHGGCISLLVCVGHAAACDAQDGAVLQAEHPGVPHGGRMCISRGASQC